MESVTAPDGVRLRVEESGDPGGVPLLLIHGFSQSLDAWDTVVAGPLARTHRLVRFDLRGHGSSDKPADDDAYTEGRRWAGDIAAIVAQLRLERPVLVGWSYGGYVIADYLREYGPEALGGIILAGGATKKGTPDARPFNGLAAKPLWVPMFDDDEAVWHPALAAFGVVMTAAPLDPALRARLLERNAQTPSFVRRALMSRILDNDDVLAACGLPVLIVHGADDGVVTRLAAEHHARLIPGATLAVYDGIGHMPFAEAPERFAADVAAFTSRIRRP